MDISLKELEEFLEEAIKLKDKKHKNILPTVGVIWKKGDKPYIVLPYMSNGPLHQLLRKPQLVWTTEIIVKYYRSCIMLRGFHGKLSSNSPCICITFRHLQMAIYSILRCKWLAGWRTWQVKE